MGLGEGRAEADTPHGGLPGSWNSAYHDSVHRSLPAKQKGDFFFVALLRAHQDPNSCAHVQRTFQHSILYPFGLGLPESSTDGSGGRGSWEMKKSKTSGGTKVPDDGARGMREELRHTFPHSVPPDKYIISAVYLPLYPFLSSLVRIL